MKNNKLAMCVLLVLGLAIVTTAFDRPQEEKANYEYLDQQLSNAKNFTLSVLEEMPEDGYSFKPGEEMRTFSAQAFHIAYSLEWFNARLKSAPIAWEPGDEDRLSKDELIAYTAEQFDVFIQIIDYAEEDGAFIAGILGVLRHNSHHRGQMVAYYRANGMTPPAYK